MRGARFPTGEERADPSSLDAAHLLAGTLPEGPGGTAFVAPGRAAQETAAALGFEPVVVPELAEPDYGRWRGLPYEDVAQADPESFARWLADPGAAPHGAESHSHAAARVVRWLEGLRDAAVPDDHPREQVPAPGAGLGALRAMVVCDVGAVRAAVGHALGVGPLVAARFDLAPLSLTQLSATPEGWRIGYVNRKAAP